MTRWLVLSLLLVLWGAQGAVAQSLSAPDEVFEEDEEEEAAGDAGGGLRLDIFDSISPEMPGARPGQLESAGGDIVLRGYATASIDTPIPTTGIATRIFAGPRAFPPEDFAAYAVVVFKSAPLASDRDRWIEICKGYHAALLAPAEVDVPRDQQLVTIWPVVDDPTGWQLMLRPRSEQAGTCAEAVDGYGLPVALRALGDARASRRLSDADRRAIQVNRGPFVFAWNPADSMGAEDALILRMDLSDIDSAEWARARFEAWRDEIEARQDLWLDGWNEPALTELVGIWADRWGEAILARMWPL